MFVLSTGCRWRDLPQKLGCGSGHTAWRRLREWQDAAVWDRGGKSGSKCHILCDRNGLPLHVLASAANTHDSQLFVPLLETNPGVPHGRGRPRRRPDKLHADKGYDYRPCRSYLHRRGIGVGIARRGVEDPARLGRVRWVVERTVSWLLRFKRLGLRYDCTEATYARC